MVVIVEEQVLELLEQARSVEKKYVNYINRQNVIPNKLIKQMEELVKCMSAYESLSIAEELQQEFWLIHNCLRNNLFLEGKLDYK